VIDEGYHAQLLAAIDEVALHAGVPKAMFFRSATEFCSPGEIAWLAGYRTHQENNSGGLCIHGKGDRISTRFSAMAAALIRNYIHARVVSLTDFLDEEDAMDGSVLFIPNFYMVAVGKPLTSWQIQLVFDHLTKRFLAGKMTVVFVENLQALEKQYGSLIHDFVTSELAILEA